MRKLVLLYLFAAALPLAASPLSNTARAVIPAAVQQIIAVDYREINNSPSAQALKEKVLPAPLKEFETALRGVGLVPEQDMDQLVFVSFRGKDALKFLGVAQGQFPGQKLRLRIVKQQIKGVKYRLETIYPMGSGMSMVLLDPTTMIFGESAVLKQAIDARNGESGGSLNANTDVTDMMSGVVSEPVWSVLDKQGAHHMLKAALGDVAQLADYETVKNRVKGARYGMNFARGVDFDLNVITSDTVTAATLSTLVKAGMLYKKQAGSELEKSMLENVTVKAESNNVKMLFKTDDTKFQALLNSDLFAAVSK